MPTSLLRELRSNPAGIMEAGLGRQSKRRGQDVLPQLADGLLAGPGHFEAIHSSCWPSRLALASAVRRDLDDVVEHFQYFKRRSERRRGPGVESLLCTGRSVDHGHAPANHVPASHWSSHTGDNGLHFSCRFAHTTFCQYNFWR